MKSLTVTAKVKAKPGKEDEVLKLLLSLVAPSRKDPGCLNYDLHRSQNDPTSFLFHENWESRELLDRHLAKSELQTILFLVSQMVVEPPEISLWDKVI